MKIIKPSYKILGISTIRPLEFIEIAGRTCYKSEELITDDSNIKFVNKLLHELHHESVIEHVSMSVRFICDRGVSHELVRHRLASFSQESTRYCNYSKDKFGNEITVIEPCFLQQNTFRYLAWKQCCENSEKVYFELIEDGAKPQEARSVLPNSLKTEVVMTANVREWRHVFQLRTSKAAHPQMRELMVPLLDDCKTWIPVIFDDISGE